MDQTIAPATTRTDAASAVASISCLPAANVPPLGWREWALWTSCGKNQPVVPAGGGWTFRKGLLPLEAHPRSESIRRLRVRSISLTIDPGAGRRGRVISVLEVA